MSLPRITVQGYLRMPDGTPMANARVKFALSHTDSDLSSDTVVTPHPVEALTDGNGHLSVDLWSNDRGFQNTHYNVVAIVTEHQRDISYRLGRMQVTENGSTDLEQLLTEQVVRSLGVDEQTLEAALRAETAAQAAAADAAAVNPGNIQAAAEAYADQEVGALEGQIPAKINEQMYFTGTVDPDASEPDEVNGGVFPSLLSLLATSPPGGVVRALIPAGKVIPFDQSISLSGRHLLIVATGGGDRPTLQCSAVISSSGLYNQFDGFIPNNGGVLEIEGVDIALPQEKADVALPWNSNRAFLRFISGNQSTLAIRNCTVTGGADVGLVSLNGGVAASIAMRSVVLDGQLFGVVGAGSGACVIASSVVTLANGAAIRDGGTLGVNVIEN